MDGLSFFEMHGKLHALLHMRSHIPEQRQKRRELPCCIVHANSLLLPYDGFSHFPYGGAPFRMTESLHVLDRNLRPIQTIAKQLAHLQFELSEIRSDAF